MPVARDKAHAAARRAAERAGVVGKPCCRCGWPILAGQSWDLDHVDNVWADGGGGRRLPAHSYCNRSAGARLGNSRRRQLRRCRMATTITVWPSLGVEVSADRARTWVARAALDADGRVVVELLDPLPGAAMVVGMVTGWWEEWNVDQIGIDPRSPSSTLVEPLTDEGMPLKAADAVGMAVAHGRFQDLLSADRLRIRGHDALDTAARQAQERRLAGSQAVERYQQGADPAPLVAAELAVWALGDPDTDAEPTVAF